MRTRLSAAMAITGLIAISTNAQPNLVDPYEAPPGYVVLASANYPDCSDVRYEIKEKKLAQHQLPWMRAILNFIHTPKPMPSSYAYESTSDTPVSETELRQLLSSNEFKRWAGPKTIRAINGLLRARKAIQENEGRLFRGDESDTEYGGILKKYTAARDQLIGALITQFQLVRIDLGDECD